MTRYANLLKTKLLIFVMLLLPFCSMVNGQPPAPPTGLTLGQGSNSAERAPSAPIGGGLLVLITLGMMYSGKKMLNSGPKDQE